MLRLLWILSLAFYSFTTAPDYLEWSKDAPLKFSDFKAKKPNTTESIVNLSTVISYQTKQTHGMPPEITIYNKMDRSNSWISSQNHEILRIQQIHFNTSELYARKMRKEIKKLSDLKVVQKEKYVEIIRKYTSTLYKIQRSRNVILDDQPDLIKLREKEVTDSLNLYSDFLK